MVSEADSESDVDVAPKKMSPPPTPKTPKVKEVAVKTKTPPKPKVTPPKPLPPEPLPPVLPEITITAIPTPTQSTSQGAILKRDKKKDKKPKKEKKKSLAAVEVVTETVGTIYDADGNKIWICPACAKPDDGSPMIGCDQCDDWYHWECVGITVPPSEEEQWFCVRCIAKKKTHRKRKK